MESVKSCDDIIHKLILLSIYDLNVLYDICIKKAGLLMQTGSENH